MFKQLQQVLSGITSASAASAPRLHFATSAPAHATSPVHRAPPADSAPAAGYSTFWQIDEEAVVHPDAGHCYDLAVDTFFNARHFVVIAGRTGPQHDHSYRMRARCVSPGLSLQDHTVIGFHELRTILHDIASAYNNRLLNDLPVFRRLQPTTENLAAVLFQQIQRELVDLPLTLVSVTVWESPTEAATYRVRAPY
ncbi:MAG TPA: 6-carboxytetrahydropterin synthase [Roseiflexaceae bacterium]|nr:6-carboxytetrahydropterin synthase [Roseiflexaceae bacterium]